MHFLCHIGNQSTWSSQLQKKGCFLHMFLTHIQLLCATQWWIKFCNREELFCEWTDLKFSWKYLKCNLSNSSILPSRPVQTIVKYLSVRPWDRIHASVSPDSEIYNQAFSQCSYKRLHCNIFQWWMWQLRGLILLAHSHFLWNFLGFHGRKCILSFLHVQALVCF